MTVLVEEAPSLHRSRPGPSGPLELPAARGPVSQSVLDHLTGGGGQVVDASSGVAGQPDDADFQLALWLANVIQVTTFAGVDPDRPSSLRMRTLHWYLEQTFEAQLRRLVPASPVEDLSVRLRSLRDRLDDGGPSSEDEARRRVVASAPHGGWETELQALALARIEPPLQPAVARLLDAAHGTSATSRQDRLCELGLHRSVALAAAPACGFALANAAWLFSRDRRWRGAAIGRLCLLGLDSCTVTDELLPALERSTPWLVDDAAWGASVTSVLLGSVRRACADPVGA